MAALPAARSCRAAEAAWRQLAERAPYGLAERAIEHADRDQVQAFTAKHFARHRAHFGRGHAGDLLAQRADMAFLAEQRALTVVRAEGLRVVEDRLELPLIAPLGLLELLLADGACPQLFEQAE